MENVTSVFQQIIIPILTIFTAIFSKYLSSKTENYRKATDELIEAQKELENIKQKELEAKFDSIESNLNSINDRLDSTIEDLTNSKNDIIAIADQLKVVSTGNIYCYKYITNLNNYIKRLSSATNAVIYNKPKIQEELRQDMKDFDDSMTELNNAYMPSFDTTKGGQ